MPHTIETAPKNGEFVIIVDDASGRFDVAQWSASRAWVRENGEPSQVTPSHWNPISSAKYSAPFNPGSREASQDDVPEPVASSHAAPQEIFASGFVSPDIVPADTPEIASPVEAETTTDHQPVRLPAGRRGFATSIAAALAAAVLAGWFFQADIAASLARYPALQNFVGDGVQLASQELRKLSLLVGLPQSPESKKAEAAVAELAEARRTIDAINLQLRSDTARLQSIEQEREKAAALAQTATAARDELVATAEKLRAALDKEQVRTAALASELATARRDYEAKLASSSEAAEKAAQLGRTNEAAVGELRKTVQQERDKNAVLTSELAAARLDYETRTASATRAQQEALQVGRTNEAAVVELWQSLQRERDKAAALARDLEAAQGQIQSLTATARAASSKTARTAPAVEAAVAAQPPVAPEVQASPEAVRLTKRAKALLAQGNIGAARTILERVVEMGSAEAVFALAETYDPRILSNWGTYGTRGDAAKARELYARAMAGGIQEAKDRFDALRQ